MVKETDTFDELTKEVRNAYFMEVRLFNIRTQGIERTMTASPDQIAQWDGGRDSRGVVHKPVWPKIVKHAFKCDVAPLILLKAVFRATKGNRPPFPNMLLTPEAADLARHYKVNLTTSLQIGLDTVKAEAVRLFRLRRLAYKDTPVTEAWRAVITEPTLSGGPLFRLCLACDLGQVDLARGFWDNAKMEYIQSPEEYDTAYGKFLPTAFREEARGCLSQILKR
jgi:hypothetical protein